MSLGIYFYMLKIERNPSAVNNSIQPLQQLNTTTTDDDDAQRTFEDVRYHWLPLPILIIYTAAYNIGMGSLTWVVATEILPVQSRLDSCDTICLVAGLYYDVPQFEPH